jgi:hypothetical protein
MSTSGLSSFNLDLTELVEEAFERCGKELRSGYDLKTARRSINLLTIEWANRGLNLWTIEQGQIPLVTGQAIYPLPIDTIDLLDTVIRTGTDQNQIDINITRISESTYITIPTKNAQGRPIQVWVNRQSGNTNSSVTTTLNGAVSSTDTTITVVSAANLPSSGYIKVGDEIIVYQNVSGNQLLNCFRGQANTIAASHLSGVDVYQTFVPNINVWPTPNSPGDQYTFVYYRLRRIQDSGGGVSTQDIPFRFINCMVAGLAFNLSVKLPDVDPNRVLFLKQDYEQQFQLAADEDREKASIRFVPRNLFY